ncbi:WD40 domain-containing protein [Streptomyces sp. CA-210063]|uniref:WD40 repeat domain-containing protein n=1 Tax=Streptomyces sp. CA-210063 TaxID=2801029 RepID=UPI00214D0661|nr:WD40 repeat domain-containing protein [Streptomyces sp. CA-210063]UUU35798.1 WD40 domain-containing protein [Streptomyces sp. CA-210063]
MDAGVQPGREAEGGREPRRHGLGGERAGGAMPVWSVVFSLDGRLLATSGNDAIVQI